MKSYNTYICVPIVIWYVFQILLSLAMDLFSFYCISILEWWFGFILSQSQHKTLQKTLYPASLLFLSSLRICHCAFHLPWTAALMALLQLPTLPLGCYPSCTQVTFIGVYAFQKEILLVSRTLRRNTRSLRHIKESLQAFDPFQLKSCVFPCGYEVNGKCVEMIFKLCADESPFLQIGLYLSLFQHCYTKQQSLGKAISFLLFLSLNFCLILYRFPCIAQINFLS